ncbi:uncharacterized protein LOC141852198 [Brevipalpus obovatus]|uniref:uncharacterized protein LOC141852198 n=1 Tax=Brevipalpus obovatus TaxID=246614 RepID=UPI003D9EC12B
MSSLRKGELDLTEMSDELKNIPLADEDAEDEPETENSDTNYDDTSKFGLVSDSGFPNDQSFESLCSNEQGSMIDPDLNLDEIQEKERLIQQVLELQNTLDDLSLRVDSVKEENLKLRSENQVLGQYIENLMSASSVFQSTSPTNKAKKKGKR